MTIYAACLRRLGLSQAEAARLHGVRLDTVKSWGSGRNRPPQGVWDDLRTVEAESRAIAAGLAASYDGADELRLVDSEDDARELAAIAGYLLSTAPGTRVAVGSRRK